MTCALNITKDIDIFPDFKRVYIRENPSSLMGNMLNISFPSFSRLAIIHEKRGEIQDAINLCELAIAYNLQGDFEGRLEKLKRKQIKA